MHGEQNHRGHAPVARIFLSHASGNDAEVIVLRDWLLGEGWNDLFLDLDPEKGLKPGDRWQVALRQAAERCECVIFLLSPSWAASRWCLAEFLLAKSLNKRIIGLIVEEMPLSDLPSEMTAEWQLVDLTAGKRDYEVTVTPTGDKPRRVALASEGLDRLRIGLMQAGIDARYFVWPPEGDPERAPYRGLEPLQAEDAGIFFGREGSMVVGLDALRGLRTSAPPRLVAILGASGAGKSSFVRAGLLPRLARESQHFRPLPIIRPEDAIVTGEAGLIVSLEQGLKQAGLVRTRTAIRKAIESSPAGLASLLRELAENNTAPCTGGGSGAPKPPTLVLPVDQAEELFHGEGAEEARAFFDLLRPLVTSDDPALIVLFTIRSDGYERLQTVKALEGLRQHTLSLPPMPRGSYAEVIKGPAQRLEGTRRPLTIEEPLVDAILADIEEGAGKDALPLLAFTLERLYREAGGDGDMKLAEYEELGGVKGSIEAAVERAMRSAAGDPRIPGDRTAHLNLLRRALIPRLASVDPDTGSPRRHIARRSEIPEESLPLIDLLVAQHLLATDLAEDGAVTIEPIHEALLRQWGLLHDWLEEDLGVLTTLEGVKREAADWVANERALDWINHTGTRLEEAERFAGREDLAGALGPDAQAYLKQCRHQEDARQRERRERLAAERAEQERRVQDAEALAAANARTARRTRLGLLMALVLVALAGWEWREAERNMALALAERSAKVANRMQLAEMSLAAAQEPLDRFFERTAMRVDTIWRLCSRPDGLVSRWLAEVGPDSADQEKLVRHLNSIFVPLVDADPYVSSMMIVGPGGFEYVVLDERDFSESQAQNFLVEDDAESQTHSYRYAWRNRVMRFDDWRQAREWYWKDDAAQRLKGRNPSFELKQLSAEIDGAIKRIEYDPRYRRYARPWLREEDRPRLARRLWAPGEPDIHWTPPYIFFTSKTPGITASRGWKNADGEKYVVAVDFTLTKLSTITTRLRVQQRGMVFMFDENGSVVGLPRGLDEVRWKGESDEELSREVEQLMANLLIAEPRGLTPDEIPKALEVGQVGATMGIDMLKPAFEAWREAHDEHEGPRDGPFDTRVDFEVGGESWTGQFKSVQYPRGDRMVQIAVIAPTEELLASVELDAAAR